MKIMGNDELVCQLLEGVGWAEAKGNFKTNSTFTFRKAMHSLGISNFPDSEKKELFKKMHTDKLQGMLDAADDKSSLEGLVTKLEKWIKAAGGLKRIANTSGDASDIKNYNQAIITITTQLNNEFLGKAKAKLSKIK
jgi:hypothetical protein